jgi:hypothetical protein
LPVADTFMTLPQKLNRLFADDSCVACDLRRKQAR